MNSFINFILTTFFVLLILTVMSCSKQNLKPELNDIHPGDHLTNFRAEPDIIIWPGIWDGQDIETNGLGCLIVEGICFVEVRTSTAEYPVNATDLPAVIVLDGNEDILLPKTLVSDTTHISPSKYAVTLREV